MDDEREERHHHDERAEGGDHPVGLDLVEGVEEAELAADAHDEEESEAGDGAIREAPTADGDEEGETQGGDAPEDGELGHDGECPAPRPAAWLTVASTPRRLTMKQK